MARYLFHVFCGGDVHMDENGQVFSDLQGAKARAAEIANELAVDGYCVTLFASSMKRGTNWIVSRSAPT